MNKLAKLVANGRITVEELASANDLIERAKLVRDGIEACLKTISFPLGASEVECYYYMDKAGEYTAWGDCNQDGIFTCLCNWGGNHVIGECDLTNFAEVFMAFENEEFGENLRRFLKAQIDKANEN